MVARFLCSASAVKKSLVSYAYEYYNDGSRLAEKSNGERDKRGTQYCSRTASYFDRKRVDVFHPGPLRLVLVILGEASPSHRYNVPLGPSPWDKTTSICVYSTVELLLRYYYCLSNISSAVALHGVGETVIADMDNVREQSVPSISVRNLQHYQWYLPLGCCAQSSTGCTSL